MYLNFLITTELCHKTVLLSAAQVEPTE